MAWWKKIFKQESKSRLHGLQYKIASKLYSADAKREVEIREFSNGEVYLVEREWVAETTFEDRYSGRMVGPFASSEIAEKFIVTTSWFCGHGEHL